ncbi:unnamed protein product, partial [Urochloa humidicola]
ITDELSLETGKVARCFNYNTTTSQGTHPSAQVGNGATPQRAAGTKVETPSNEAGAPGAKRADEAARDLLHKWTSGCRCLPALPGGFHSHAYAVTM